MTFAESATPWPAVRRSSKGERLKPRTVASYDSILARDLLPMFGATPVLDLTPELVRGPTGTGRTTPPDERTRPTC